MNGYRALLRLAPRLLVGPFAGTLVRWFSRGVTRVELRV